MIPDPLAALGGRRIGAHLALGHGMVKAADRARAIGATTIQVFSDNPTAWRRRAQPPRELEAFRLRLAAYDVAPTATHAAYLVNLAGPEPDFWSRSVDVLVAELRMAAEYNARLVNMHVGSHRGSGFEAGRRRLAQGIARAFEIEGSSEAAERADGSSEAAERADGAIEAAERADGAIEAAERADGASEATERAEGSSEAARRARRPILVLENSAGGGDGMGSTVEELAAILEALDEVGAPMARIAICLDTAHLWGAGHEISRPEVIDAILADCDRWLGPERLAMLHLNDSKSALGSRLDRHQHIGAGRIGELGMRHLVTHPRLAAVPMFLETPGMDEGYDAVNMDRIRALVAGEALATLPAEAFALRGSRARVAPADE